MEEKSDGLTSLLLVKENFEKLEEKR